MPPPLRPRVGCPRRPTLDSRFIDDLPRRLIGDRAYDADRLDAALGQLGTLDDRLAPSGSGSPQEPRVAVRFAGIGAGGEWSGSLQGSGNCRRLAVRYERHALNYLGFVHLGCILILPRQI
ncbi:MAG: hypothetical protein ACLQUY_13540 [Ktedonobacterales bacterium]